MHTKSYQPDPKSDFFAIPDGMTQYQIGRETLLRLAERASAKYKIGRCLRIKREPFEKELENYLMQAK